MDPESLYKQESSSSLHVKGLTADITHAILYDKFSVYGPINSITIGRITNRDYPHVFARIDFLHRNNAEQAREKTNFTLINDSPIIVKWWQTKPITDTGFQTIYIKNLDVSIDDAALFNQFSVFGEISSCRVCKDKNGLSKGFGIVCFKSNEAAKRAIEKAEGMCFNGKNISVQEHIPQIARAFKLSNNIFIRNFGQDWNENKLREMFKTFGKITSIKITTDENGKSKGCGFVAFETTEAAESAIAALNNKQLQNGKFLHVSLAQKKSESQKIKISEKCELYVKNLDPAIDDERLRTEFAIFGTIASARVITYGDGITSKGYGFVCFNSLDASKRAVTEMNGKLIGSTQIYVSFTLSIEERTALAARKSHIPLNMNKQQTEQIIPPNNSDDLYVPSFLNTETASSTTKTVYWRNPSTNESNTTFGTTKTSAHGLNY